MTGNWPPVGYAITGHQTGHNSLLSVSCKTFDAFVVFGYCEAKGGQTDKNVPILTFAWTDIIIM